MLSATSLNMNQSGIPFIVGKSKFNKIVYFTVFIIVKVIKNRDSYLKHLGHYNSIVKVFPY